MRVKRKRVAIGNFWYRFVILPEWVYVDMQEVIDIQIYSSRINGK